MLRLSLILLLMAEVATCCAPHSPTRPRPKQQDMDVSPSPYPPGKPSPTPPPTMKPSPTPPPTMTPSPTTPPTMKPSPATLPPSTRKCANPDAISEAIPDTMPDGSKQPTTENGIIKCPDDTPLIYVRKNGGEIVRASEVKCTKGQWVATGEDGRQMFNVTQVSCAAPLPMCAVPDAISDAIPDTMPDGSKQPTTENGIIKCPDDTPLIYVRKNGGEIVRASEVNCTKGQWVATGEDGRQMFNVTQVSCAAPLPMCAVPDAISDAIPDTMPDGSKQPTTENGIIKCPDDTPLIYVRKNGGEIVRASEVKCTNLQWVATPEDGGQMFNVTQVSCAAPLPMCAVPDAISDAIPDTMPDGSKQPTTENGIIKCPDDTPLIYVRKNGGEIVRASEVNCTKGQWVATGEDGRQMFNVTQVSCAAPLPMCAVPDAISDAIPDTMPDGSKQPTTENGIIKCPDDTPLIYVRKNGGEIVRASEVKCTNLQWVATPEDGGQMFNVTQVSCAAPLPMCAVPDAISDAIPDTMPDGSKQPTTENGIIKCPDDTPLIYVRKNGGEIVRASEVKCTNLQWVATPEDGGQMFNVTQVSCAAPLPMCAVPDAISDAIPDTMPDGSKQPTTENGIIKCPDDTPLIYVRKNGGEIVRASEVKCTNLQWVATPEDGGQMFNVTQVSCAAPLPMCAVPDAISDAIPDTMPDGSKQPTTENGIIKCPDDTPLIYVRKNGGEIVRASEVKCTNLQWVATPEDGGQMFNVTQVSCAAPLPMCAVPDAISDAIPDTMPDGSKQPTTENGIIKCPDDTPLIYVRKNGGEIVRASEVKCTNLQWVATPEDGGQMFNVTQVSCAAPLPMCAVPDAISDAIPDTMPDGSKQPTTENGIIKCPDDTPLIYVRKNGGEIVRASEVKCTNLQWVATPEDGGQMFNVTQVSCAAPLPMCAVPDAISDAIPDTMPDGSKQPTTENGIIKCPDDTPLIYVRKNGGEIVRASEVKCTNLQWVATPEDGGQMFNVTQVSCAAPLPMCAVPDAISDAIPDTMPDGSKQPTTENGIIKCPDDTPLIYVRKNGGEIVRASEVKCTNLQWVATPEDGGQMFNVTQVSCAAPLPMCAVPDAISDAIPDTMPDGSKQPSTENGIIKCPDDTPLIYVRKNGGEIVRASEVKCTNLQWVATPEDGGQMFNVTQVSCAAPLPKDCPDLDEISQVELERRFPNMGGLSKPMVTKEGAVCTNATSRLFFIAADSMVRGASAMACRSQQWIVLGNRHIPLAETTKVACASPKCTPLGALKKEEIDEIYRDDDNACSMPNITEHGASCNGPIEELFFTSGNGMIVHSTSGKMKCSNEQWSTLDFDDMEHMMDNSKVCCIEDPFLKENPQFAGNRCPDFGDLREHNRFFELFGGSMTSEPRVKDGYATCTADTPTFYFTDGANGQIQTALRMECIRGGQWAAVNHAGGEVVVYEPKVICSD